MTEPGPGFDPDALQRELDRAYTEAAARSREATQVGPYRVVERIGVGGQATVLKVINPHLDRAEALKILRFEEAQEPELVARFRRETRILAQLRHPNIVPVYETGEHEGRPFYTTEFVDGESAQQIIARLGRLPPRAALRIALDAACALAAAHGAGIVHRDIKPGNVLVSRAADLREERRGNEAIRIRPTFIAAFYNRGNSRLRLGEAGSAFDDYTEAIRLQPDFASAYLNRGRCHEALGSPQDAARDYGEAIRLDPDDPAAWNNRGLIRLRAGELEDARSDLDQAVRHAGDLAEPYWNRGRILLAMERAEEALADWAEAARRDPDNLDLYVERARVLEDTGDLAGAIADYGEILRLRPDLIEARANRGHLRERSGDPQGAAQDYRDVLRMAPAEWPAGRGSKAGSRPWKSENSRERAGPSLV